jgi:hypothetical protein
MRTADLDEWMRKLLMEGESLTALGLLDVNAEVRCPECAAVVPRRPGWAMEFVCPCGWALIEIEDPPTTERQRRPSSPKGTTLAPCDGHLRSDSG